MQFEWDPVKARRNLSVHGVDFQDATWAVLDPFRLEVVDDRFDYGEDRIQVIGASRGGVLFVVIVFRDEHLCRIISARPATRKAGGISSMTKTDPPEGKTDWARLAAMSDAERLAGALADPDAQPLSDAMLARAKRANDVKAIRARLAMTQARFSQCYHVPLSTLRDWEQGRTRPDAPARALLTAIANDPETMRRLVGGEFA